MIQYTSGSVGAPKGVLSLHRGILHQVWHNTRLDRIVPEDRIFPNNLAWYLNALLNGASVFPFSLKERGFAALAGWLSENEITSCSCVPTVFRRVAALLKPEERLPRLRLIKLTGEAVNRSDVDLFRKHFSQACQLRFSLGTTETGVIATRIIGHDTELEDDILASGLPVLDTEIFLFDEAGKLVPEGEAGEIVVRSRFLAAGYWQQPELTASRFLGDPDDPFLRTYLTGDRGRIGPDGMLVHLGRSDDQVKIRGNRVELTDVEGALLRLEGIADGAVAAHDDGNGEKYLVAYCVLSGAQALSANDIRRALVRALPDFMVPSIAVILPELPLLPNGKTNRRGLAAPRALVSDSFEAPRTPLESLVAETWGRILAVERVGVRDSFFDLGGSSLMALEVVTALERATGVGLSPAAMVGQTLAQIVMVYQQGMRPSGRGVLSGLRRAVSAGWWKL